jgi:hypothetical protein
MILFHKIVEVFHLTIGDRSPMRLIAAPDGSGNGLARINSDGFGYDMAADGFPESVFNMGRFSPSGAP